ncbi:hypothetical protein [Streptomyces beihaiensis]|uniref:PE-PGRS family protein n=1 Tax=Streptomyces beihaiensis TaxID=2984495 RepID=A0ABT3TWX0_9ACTN|nr:hypothetical protein [Streptomyces beihaiensis]MCX3061548.1 hypothetical protein [Streptomyces beihaiensis]
MSYTSIEIATGQHLKFEATRDGFRLWPAVDGAKLVLTLGTSVFPDLKEPLQIQVSGWLSVGTHPQTDLRDLCELTAADIHQPSVNGGRVELVGLVSNAQLRVIEELRRNKELWFSVEVRITYLERESELRMVSKKATLSFDIPISQWAKQLEKVSSAAYVEVLVPVTADPKLAKAAGRVRQARKLTQAGHAEEGIGETRKALERYRKAYRTWALTKTAAAKDAHDRTKEERWALLVEDAFSLLSGAAHDDPGTTDQFEWPDSEAVTLNALVAGLLTRLANDPEHRVL